MSDEEVEIHVALLGEGVDVWRPVKAHRVSGDVYRIIDQPYDREIEAWQFTPGMDVRCEQRALSDGMILVAVSRHLTAER